MGPTMPSIARRALLGLLTLAALRPVLLHAESIAPWPESEHDWRTSFTRVTGSNIPPQGLILHYQEDLPATIHVQLSLHKDLLDRVLPPYVPGDPAPFRPASTNALPLPATGYPEWWVPGDTPGLMWSQARGRNDGMLTIITLPDPADADRLILQLHWQAI